MTTQFKMHDPELQILIEGCKQQKNAAQFAIYKKYAKAMFTKAHRIVKHTADAEDVMQEAFLKAFQKIDSYQGQVSFGAWLSKIVVNQAIDHYKKNARQQTHDWDERISETEVEETFDWNATDEQLLKVKKGVEALKDSYRLIFSLVYLEGYDADEVTEMLGISAENFRTTLCRARIQLQKIVKAYD